MMREQLSALRWKRLSLTSVAGLVLVMAAVTAYDQWRKRDGWCVMFYPDGSGSYVDLAQDQASELKDSTS